MSERGIKDVAAFFFKYVNTVSLLLYIDTNVSSLVRLHNYL